ncbi:hypothetical protein K7432_017027, partial [Basidiobolus ranarum]
MESRSELEETISVRRSTRTSAKNLTYLDQGTSGDSEKEIVSLQSNRLTLNSRHKRKSNHLKESGIYQISRGAPVGSPNTRISSRWSPNSRRYSSRLRKDSKVNYYEPSDSPHNSPSSDDHSINSKGLTQRRRRRLSRDHMRQSSNDENGDASDVRTENNHKKADTKVKEENDKVGVYTTEEEKNLFKSNGSGNESTATEIISQSKRRRHSFHRHTASEKEDVNNTESRDCSVEVDLELASGSIVDAVGRNMVRRSSRLVSKQQASTVPMTILNNSTRDPDDGLNIDDTDLNSDCHSVSEPIEDGG